LRWILRIWVPSLPPPLLGENTREVLASKLGYDEAKLETLKKQRII
jgi:crotonobetainyl-CoA:carnitine CoA-transferase CaiB-like acyl-CoA transferase